MNNEPLPLVTVNVLSYNRRDELRHTLRKVYEQDYKNLEVIVVDNASTDDSGEMVKKEFPSVILIPLEYNIGIAGWNEGFKIAKGEYVLVLDDDSYPDRRTIEEGIEALINNEFSIAAYNIINLRTRSSETADFNKINPYQFTGCGALIKREVLENIGYYDKKFFIYLNEIDFCIRAYNAGYSIIYLENAIVFHSQSPVSRKNPDQNPFRSNHRYYNYYIGWYIILLKHFKFKYFLKYSFKWILNRLIIALKYSYLTTFFKALFVIVKKTPTLYKQRITVDKKIQEYYKNGNIPFIDRGYFPYFKKDNIRKL